jgi:hypothetical protein
MRSSCAILLIMLALSASACSSNPQIDKPTPPDHYDMVEQQMQYVGYGATYTDVTSLVGKPDAIRQTHGADGVYVLCAKWVGVHDWLLCFSNVVDDYGRSTPPGDSLYLDNKERG